MKTLSKHESKACMIRYQAGGPNGRLLRSRCFAGPSIGSKHGASRLLEFVSVWLITWLSPRTDLGWQPGQMQPVQIPPRIPPAQDDPYCATSTRWRPLHGCPFDIPVDWWSAWADAATTNHPWIWRLCGCMLQPEIAWNRAACPSHKPTTAAAGPSILWESWAHAKLPWPGLWSSNTAHPAILWCAHVASSRRAWPCSCSMGPAYLTPLRTTITEYSNTGFRCPPNSITVDKCGGSARKSKNRLCWRESCRCNKDRHTFKWKWAARKWGVGRSKPSAAQPGHAKYATTWFLPEIEHRSHDFAAGSSASRSKSYIAYLIRHCHTGMCGEKGRSCLTLLAKHVSSERGHHETNKGRICGKRTIRKLLQIFIYIGI